MAASCITADLGLLSIQHAATDFEEEHLCEDAVETEHVCNSVHPSDNDAHGVRCPLLAIVSKLAIDDWRHIWHSHVAHMKVQLQ
jgi:hypothetical protein